MYMLYVWLGVIILATFIELVDAGTLVSAWFAVGAVIPMLMSIYRTNAVWYIWLQVLIFGVVTVCCLLFLRKAAIKWLYRNKKESKTNLDNYVGNTYKVEAENDNFFIKINGIEYSILFEDEEVVNAGDKVTLIKFQGNKAVVKK